MAITIQNTPADYSSVNGDLIYTCFESVKAVDPITYPNYKYICDIYIGGTLKATLKMFPNPANSFGIFNIGCTVRSYIDFQFNPASSFIAQSFGAGEWFLNVQCKFREEYGGFEYTSSVDDSVRRFYNHYNGRLITGETILPAKVDSFASNRPITGRRDTVKVGQFRSFVPIFNESNTSISIDITAYDADFNVLFTETSSTFTVTAGELLLLDCGIASCNALFTNQIDDTVDVYYINPGSGFWTFRPYSECKYMPVCLHFLNQYGGFESIDFTKVSRKTSTIEKKTYEQLPYRINNSTGASELRTSNNVLNDTVTTFAVKYNEKMKLNTDILTDVEFHWLKELIYSPVIYLEDTSGVLIPVAITNTDYEEKKVVNDHCQNLMVEIDFLQTFNTQYR